jgi:hypothetical protein
LSNAHAPYAQWSDDTAEGGLVASSIEYILIDAPALVLEHGAPMQLTATAYDASDVEVPAVFQWDVNNAYPATVSSTGLLTAHGSGDVAVTASVPGSSGTPDTVVIFVRGALQKRGSEAVPPTLSVKRAGVQVAVTQVYQKRGGVAVRVYY